MACAIWTRLTGFNRSVSRVAGAEPRTSTPAVTPAVAMITKPAHRWRAAMALFLPIGERRELRFEQLALVVRHRVGVLRLRKPARANVRDVRFERFARLEADLCVLLDELRDMA